MENLLDFTNYRDHPTHKDFIVFHYKRADQAGFFENLLVEHKIEYERFDDNTHKGLIYYFGIRRSYFKEADKLNNITIGQYRDKFIPGAGLRWFTIIFGVLVVTLAIVGYVVSR